MWRSDHPFFCVAQRANTFTLRLRPMVHNWKYALPSAFFGLLTGLIFPMKLSASSPEPAWPGPAIVLDNGKVRLVISPQIGRITAFHQHGEANWLAPATEPLPPGQPWPSYPGDKLWPSAQFLWPQIHGSNGPDPVFDKLPWTVTRQEPLVVTLLSATSPRLGVQAERTIRLSPEGTRLLQTCKLIRREASAFPVCVWMVTTCPLADYILLDLHPQAARSSGRPYHPFGSPAHPLDNVRVWEEAAAVQFGWPTTGAQKAGTYGHWIALIRGDRGLVQRVQFVADGCYLEESNLQAWVAPHNRLCEIETSSPHWFLRPGEEAVWDIQWELVDFPATCTTPPERALHLRQAGRLES